METKFYPELSVPLPKNPNRFYAIPLIGIFIKLVMLIPVFIYACVLGIVVAIFTMFINPFFVLFKHKYWDRAYRLSGEFFTYTTKILFFMAGFTDKYPGFKLESEGIFDLAIPKQTQPKIFFAIPLVGMLVRGVLLIPFFIYSSVLKTTTQLAMIVSALPVLFSGTYPEWTFELIRDYQRVSLASFVYVLGISDSYPSFKISMKDQTLKIILIILGALITIGSSAHSFTSPKKTPTYTPSFTSLQTNYNSNR